MQLSLLLLVAQGVRAGDVAGLIAVPKVPLPPALPESLSAEQVAETVQANRGELQRCYDDWLARHPLRGNAIFAAEVALAIAPDGGSEHLSLRGLDDQAMLATCLEGELSRWRFPRSQLGADVHVPLVLAGRKSDDAARPSARALHASVIAQRGSLAPCFERLEGAPPPLSASLNIDAEGKARLAQLRGAERDAKLRSCLRDALEAWRFPRAQKGAELAFPL